MDVLEGLVKLAGGEGLALFIVVGGGAWMLWFLSMRLWPWYSSVHRPAVVELRKQQISADAALSNALGVQAAAIHALTAVMSKTLNGATPSSAMSTVEVGDVDSFYPDGHV